MFANSLLIRLISASLLLQLRMSEMKTARPRIPSPRTAGIMDIFSSNHSLSENVKKTYRKLINLFNIVLVNKIGVI